MQDSRLGQRPGDQPPVGAEDHRRRGGGGQRGPQPLVVAGHRAQRRRVEGGGGHDHEDFAFEGVGGRAQLDVARQVVVVAGRAAVERPRRRIAGDVDALTLGQQGEAGQRVGVLPADQRPEPPAVQLDRAQIVGVAVRPRQTLVPGGHQFAAVVDQVPAAIEDQIGVPQLAQAVGVAFVDTHRQHHPVGAGDRPDPLGLRPGHHQRGGHQPFMESVLVDRRQHPVPDRETGDETLPAHHQLRPAGGRLGDHGVEFVQRRRQVQKDRGGQHRRHPHRRKPSHTAHSPPAGAGVGLRSGRGGQ